jgi:hypothetical protein
MGESIFSQNPIIMVRYLILSFACLVLISGPVAAQWGNGVTGEGPVVKKTLTLDEFTGFTFAMSGDVVLTPGPKQMVEVEGQQNIIDLIELDVRGGHWVIKPSKNVRQAKGLTFYITMPAFDEVAVSGSGKVRGTGKFEGLEEVELALSGSGDMILDLEAEEIEGRISGSGDMRLGGKAGEVEIAISGSGNVDASSLMAETCEVHLSGSGDVSVHADGELKVSISGSGDVRYGGKASVDARISGSGSVKKM